MAIMEDVSSTAENIRLEELRKISVRFSCPYSKQVTYKLEVQEEF
jgi:3-methyladenine DNA glycosylase AlkC